MPYSVHVERYGTVALYPAKSPEVRKFTDCHTHIIFEFDALTGTMQAELIQFFLRMSSAISTKEGPDVGKKKLRSVAWKKLAWPQPPRPESFG